MTPPAVTAAFRDKRSMLVSVVVEMGDRTALLDAETQSRAMLPSPADTRCGSPYDKRTAETIQPRGGCHLRRAGLLANVSPEAVLTRLPDGTPGTVGLASGGPSSPSGLHPGLHGSSSCREGLAAVESGFGKGVP